MKFVMKTETEQLIDCEHAPNDLVIFAIQKLIKNRPRASVRCESWRVHIYNETTSFHVDLKEIDAITCMIHDKTIELTVSVGNTHIVNTTITISRE